MINTHRHQTGSSLIEVLVALLVFSVGMLGLAALQLNALQGASDSSQRSQTTWIMQDLAERFRANRDGTAATYAAAPAVPHYLAACAPTTSTQQRVPRCKLPTAQQRKWPPSTAGKHSATTPPLRRSTPLTVDSIAGTQLVPPPTDLP